MWVRRIRSDQVRPRIDTHGSCQSPCPSDIAAQAWDLWWAGSAQPERDWLIQGPVWSALTVVDHVLVEDPLKVSTADDQQPIEALSTNHPDESLGEGYDRAEVREWAKAHRIKVAQRGRIANDVVERWKAATKK